jgi:hypothetical protein
MYTRLLVLQAGKPIRKDLLPHGMLRLHDEKEAKAWKRRMRAWYVTLILLIYYTHFALPSASTLVDTECYRDPYLGRQLGS